MLRQKWDKVSAWQDKPTGSSRRMPQDSILVQTRTYPLKLGFNRRLVPEISMTQWPLLTSESPRTLPPSWVTHSSYQAACWVFRWPTYWLRSVGIIFQRGGRTCVMDNFTMWQCRSRGIRRPGGISTLTGIWSRPLTRRSALGICPTRAHSGLATTLCLSFRVLAFSESLMRSASTSAPCPPTKSLPFIMPVRQASSLKMTTPNQNSTASPNPGLPPMPSALLDKHFLCKHGAQAYYGQK